MRRLIAEIVRKICDAVFECENGAESLAVFAEHQPDWVLMDVEMPRMDGIQATAALKKRFPAARVVVLTKYNDLQTREAAREAGADAFLDKENLVALRDLIKEETSKKYNEAEK